MILKLIADGKPIGVQKITHNPTSEVREKARSSKELPTMLNSYEQVHYCNGYVNSLSSVPQRLETQTCTEIDSLIKSSSLEPKTLNGKSKGFQTATSIPGDKLLINVTEIRPQLGGFNLGNTLVSIRLPDAILAV